MKYINIYPFEVEDMIRDDRLVFCIDKSQRIIRKMNEVQFGFALAIIADAKSDTTNRYEFWVEKENENAQEF